MSGFLRLESPELLTQFKCISWLSEEVLKAG